jgi:hypothetical protein
MKNLFRMVFAIGAEASLAALGSTISDLQTVGQASQDLAVLMEASETETNSVLEGEEQRFTSPPYRFRSVRYDGVLVVELISEHGKSALTLGDFLELVRLCRSEPSWDMADDEIRASLCESLLTLASQQLSGAVHPLTLAATYDLLTDSRLDAIIRLASLEVSMEYSTFPVADDGDHSDNCED